MTRNFLGVSPAAFLLLPCLAAFDTTLPPPIHEDHSCTPASQSLTEEAPSIGSAHDGPFGSNLLDQLGMRFTENRGQVPNTDSRMVPEILYTADAGGARLAFTHTGLIAIFLRSDRTSLPMSEATGRHGIPPDRLGENLPVRLRVVSMTLAGCNVDAAVVHHRAFPGYDNFYLAHCPQGITGVRSYRQLFYENIYDGIDLVYHSGSPTGLKYEFAVSPHVDPSCIRMQYDGADRIYIDGAGNLHVQTAMGEQIQQKPYTFTDDGTVVECGFLLRDTEVSFSIGSYDDTRRLVIDPWATYYGGNGDDRCHSVNSDASGNVLVAGRTTSANLPTTIGSHQPFLAGGKDLFITKFNGYGIHLWSTYYGGSGDEESSLVSSSDGWNDIVLGLRTTSQNFPVTAGAFQTSYGGGTDDAAMVKLAGNGTRVWATYFGGSGSDAVLGASTSVDESGNVFLCGATQSTNLPITSGAFQPSIGGGQDAYIAKFSAGGAILWATYFGGSGNDGAYHLNAVDASGSVVMVGSTISADFPVSAGAYQPSLAGATDAFIAQFDGSGARLWATYLGGGNGEGASGVATDNNGNVFVTGTTYSTDFPVTAGAFQSMRAGEQDCFIANFNANGGLAWATYFGGSLADYANSLYATNSGSIIVGGFTESANFPVSPGAFQGTLAYPADGFILMFTGSGARQWCTYYGGSSDDYVRTVAADGAGNVICGGGTWSTNLPTWNAYKSSYSGGTSDAFVAIFDAGGNLPVELASFAAVRSASCVELRWSTESESNNAGFEVQRSRTAGMDDWEIRGFVPGAGTSTMLRNYSFKDEDLSENGHAGSVFFRLRQLDLDGTSNYSHVIEVFPGPADDGLLLFPPYPQPASESAELAFRLPDAQSVTITLHDALGKCVARLFGPADFEAGAHSVRIRWEAVSVGIYFLRVTGTCSSAMQRFVIR